MIFAASCSALRKNTWATLMKARSKSDPVDGTYLGLTIIVVAISKAQLDALYMDLTANERVLVAL
jgi:putative lipoic acid-binding regulatory protein